MSHTPGAIVGIDATGTAYQCGCAVDGREIRLCPLHAAAPELLEAARLALLALTGEGLNDGEGAVELLTTTIAKAEGSADA